MSRRTAIIEEFDDDTDLPLPNQPLPNTGAHGPLLEEILSDDDDELELYQHPGHASPSTTSAFRSQPVNTGSTLPKNAVTDLTPYKTWTCLYPIYLDAKRPYGTGQRRIERAKSLWWPLSKDIADAANRLGLGTLHEVNKSHPRDWENPGRVRVQWKKDGKLVNPAIKSKKQLLELISLQMHLLKPENIPKPPFNLAREPQQEAPAGKAAPTSGKGKQPVTSKPKAIVHHQTKQTRRKPPVPPEPEPPLASRFSPYSPAVASGVLIETLKAGMSAPEQPGAAIGGANSGVQKGKRKVIRVRG